MFKKVLKNWSLNDVWLGRAKIISQNKDLVTFDIFDTALTRAVDSPVDIFSEVEKTLNSQGIEAKGFAVARARAEKRARDVAFKNHGFKEITFDEIYSELPAFITISSENAQIARSLELDIEKKFLFAVPDIFELTQYLTKNSIPFAFVSDMYLGKDVITDFLVNSGYAGWQDVIVSCDYRKTKSDGSIWNIEKLAGKNILHIGDNAHSDVLVPQRHSNIQTLLYARARSHLRVLPAISTTSPVNILPFSKQQRLIEIACRDDPSQANTDQQYIYALGESFGALVLGSFILWLKERAQKNNITHLAFCARDGFLMHEAWRIFGDQNITDSYLHVSRKALTLSSSFLFSRSDFLPDNLLNFLTSSNSPLTFKFLFTSIGLDEENFLKKARKNFGSLDKPIKSKRKLKNFLQQNASSVYTILEQNYNNACAYFKQQKIFEHKKMAIVDLGWNGSLQRELAQIGRSIKPTFQIMGFYYGLWNSTSGNRFLAGAMESAFFSEFDHSAERFFQFQGVDITEELHVSAEGTTIGYEQLDDRFQPCLLKQTEQEKQQYEQIVLPFQQGVLDGLRAIKNNGSYKCLSYQDLTIDNARAAYYALFNSPTQGEVRALSKIAHGVAFDHSLTPVIQSILPKNKRQCRRLIRGCNWQMGQLKYWLMLASDKQRRFIRDFSQRRFPQLSPQQLSSLESE